MRRKQTTSIHSRRKNKKTQEQKELFLYYILPFVVVNIIIFVLATSIPRFSVQVIDNQDYKTATIQITKNKLYPFKELLVSIDETPIELTKDEQGMKTIYSATLDRNGSVAVKSNGYNGMSHTVFEQISNIDDTPPVLYGEITEHFSVHIEFEDSQSGVDYDNIYGIDDTGKTVYPISIDKTAMSVEFDYTDGTLEVHVSDNMGNESVATFNKLDADSKDEENINK